MQFNMRRNPLILSGFALILGNNIAASQTRFEWPSSKIDIQSYKYWDSCIGVRERVGDSVRFHNDEIADTLHYKVNNGKNKLDDVIVSSTRLCLEKFDVNKVDLEDAIAFHQLLLDAGMDSMAHELIERKASSIGIGNRKALAGLFDSAMNASINAMPVRFQKSIEYYNRYVALGDAVGPSRKIYLLALLSGSVANSSDSVYNRVLIEKAAELAENLSDTEWNDKPGLELSLFSQGLVKRVYISELSDSLLRNFEAYNNYLATLFSTHITRKTNRSLESGYYTIGQALAPVTGHYWIPANPEGKSFPQKGAISLLIFLNRGKRTSELGVLVLAKRIKERYPELQVVIVTQTLGHLNDLNPPKPEQEAELLGKYIREFSQLDAQVVVYDTDFFKLPGYDRRRINLPTENDLAGYEKARLFLVDREGRKISSGANERELEYLTGALFRRHVNDTQTTR